MKEMIVFKTDLKMKEYLGNLAKKEDRSLSSFIRKTLKEALND